MVQTLSISRKTWWVGLVICIFLGLGLFCVLSYTSFKRAGQKEDDLHLRQELLPMATFVSNFRDSHGRLPSEDEFTTWAKTNFSIEDVWYYPEQPRFMKTWGVDGRDFAVGIWRGEWIQCYSSWDQKTFSNRNELPSSN